MMITIKEAMKLSRLPYYTIRKLCLDGKVRFVRSGTKYYLSRESLESYLNGGESNCIRQT